MAGSPIPSNFAHRMERTEPPLEANLKEQFVALWEGVFETSYDFLERVLKGGETGFNRDLFYCISRDGRTAATSHVTVSRGDPTLGGLGEVATAVGHRHQGMAAATCARFRISGRVEGKRYFSAPAIRMRRECITASAGASCAVRMPWSP